MYLPWPFSSVRRVRHGVGVLVLLMVSAVVYGFLFFSYIPWLSSTPIAEISTRGNPKPPPAWARAFAVNHGHFSYFRESTADRRVKSYAIGISMVVLCLVLRTA